VIERGTTLAYYPRNGFVSEAFLISEASRNCGNGRQR